MGFLGFIFLPYGKKCLLNAVNRVLLRVLIFYNKDIIMQYFYLFAQAAQSGSAAQTQGAGSSSQWLFLILLFAGMWFLLIAPQRKREKQRRKMLAETKVGDEVVTIGGIYGTITNKSEKTYTLKIADNTKIEILIAAVNENLTQAQAAQSSKK